MKAKWTPVAIALAAALPFSWLAWKATRKTAGDLSGAGVGAAGKTPERVAAEAAPPEVVATVGPAELEALRALALTHADAARTRAARMGLEAVVVTAVALAGRDLEATEEWARSLEPKLRDAVFASLVTELARRDAGAALRLANQIGEEAPRRQAVAHALAQLAASDPRAAWDILQGTSDPGERSAIAAPVLAAVADHDPLAVAEWIAREDTPQELANSLAVPVVQRWTQQDPEAAAAWVAAYPGGPLREEAAEALMQVWVSRDVKAASAWVERMPATVRDEMAAALGSALAGSDPSTARGLLASIQSEAWRSRLLSRLEPQVPLAPSLPEDHEHSAGAGAACGCLGE